MNSLQNKATSSRIEWIDTARGFAMLLVIIGHIYISKELKSFLYSFHMPLFFLICGMTFNKIKVSTIPIKDYVKRNFKRLVVPYFWLEFLTFPMWFLAYRVFDYNESQSFFENLKGIFISNGFIKPVPTVAPWFLLTMFLSLITYRVILSLTKGNTANEIIVIVLLSIFSVLDEGVDLPWCLNVVPIGVVFIFIGKYVLEFLKNEENYYKEKSKSAKVLLQILFWAVVFVVGLISHGLNGRVSMVGNSFGKSIFLYYITSITFSSVFLKIVKTIPNIKFVEYIGKNTLVVVAFHKPIMYIIKSIYDYSEHSDLLKIVYSCLLLLAFVPICALFNKIAPYVAGTAYKSNKLTETSKYIIAALASAVPAYYALKIVFSYIGMQYQTVILGISLAIVIAVFSICFVRIANKYFPIVFASDKN